MYPQRRHIPIPVAIMISPIVIPMAAIGFFVAALIDAARALHHVTRR
jgi:multisubunit Na+/H+ antiporter MnhC subunit